MKLGVCHLKLQLPGCRSLKEKRRIIKPLQEKLHHKFNVSVAEVGAQDRWDSAEIGIAHVSNDGQFCRSLLDHVLNFV